MAESRSKKIITLFSKDNLIHFSEAHSAKILSEEIYNLYQTSNPNEKAEIKKEVLRICNELDDFSLLNFTYYVMRLEINHFYPDSGDDLYLRSSKNFGSLLYGICAIRFNYFLIQSKNHVFSEPMQLLNQLLWQYYNNNKKFPNYDIEDKIKLFFRDVFHKLRLPMIELSTQDNSQQLIYMNQLASFDKTSIDIIMQNFPNEKAELRTSTQYATSLISLENKLKGKNSHSFIKQKMAASDALNKLLSVMPALTNLSNNDVTTSSHTSTSGPAELTIDSTRSNKDLPDSEISLILLFIEQAKSALANKKQKTFLDELYKTVQNDATGKWVFDLIKAHQLWKENEHRFLKMPTDEKRDFQKTMYETGGALGGLLALTQTNKHASQRKIIFKLLDDIYQVLFSKYENMMDRVFHDLFKRIDLLNTKEIKQFDQNQTIAFQQLFQNVIPFAMKRQCWNEKDLASFKAKHEQFVQADNLYNDLPVQTAMIYKYMESSARLVVDKYFNCYKEHGGLSKNNIVLYLESLRPLFMVILDPLISELNGNDKDKYIAAFNKFKPKRTPNAFASAFLSQIFLIATHHFITPKITRLENKTKLSTDDSLMLDCYRDANKSLVMMARIGPEVELEDNNLVDFFEHSDGATILDKMIAASEKKGSKLTDKLSGLDITSSISVPISINSSSANSNSSSNSASPTSTAISSGSTSSTTTVTEISNLINLPELPLAPEVGYDNQHATLFHANSSSSSANSNNDGNLNEDIEYLKALRIVVNHKYWENEAAKFNKLNYAVLSSLNFSTNFDLITQLKPKLNSNKATAIKLLEVINVLIPKRLKYETEEGEKTHLRIKQLAQITNKTQLDKLVQDINDPDLTKEYFVNRKVRFAEPQ